jgi:pimeloyl-ACP methyl ester carboxylesterase
MMPEIQLSQGVVRYREEGTGTPIVLIHGLLVNGNVWDRLVPLLPRRGGASSRTCRWGHIRCR